MRQILSTVQKRWLWAGFRILLLTYLAVFAESSGFLTRLEHALYDQRVAHCQRYMPRPTDRLVHLDIDDNSLTQIGRWPWHRDVMAEILDEIRLTEPKVLAMDILFAEPEEPYERGGKTIDRDAVLAEAISKFGRVLVPSSFSFEPPAAMSMIEQRLAALLTDDPELTAEQCAQRLRSEGVHPTDLDTRVSHATIAVRPEAMCARIRRELQAGRALPATQSAGGQCPSYAQLKRAILPHADPQFTGSILDHLFDEEYDRAVREQAIERFTLPMKPGLPPLLRAYDQITPILPLSQAAAYSAFVNYLPDREEGTVRTVPLLASYRGRIVPHMALATACAMLDVDVHNLQLCSNTITIPRPNGQNIVIPVTTRASSNVGPVGMLMEVPLFGKQGRWQTMYDYPRYENVAQHVSVYEVWQVCLSRRHIATNEALADRVLVQALALTDPKAAGDYAAAPLRGDAKRKLIVDTVESMVAVKSGLDGVPGLGAAEKELIANLTNYIVQLGKIVKQNDALVRQLETLRIELRGKLAGKALFLGGTGTGNVDLYPTSLHAVCPGVIVHGAVFNAILTGKMWRVAPPAVTILLTAFIGLLTGVLTSTLSPAKAWVAATVVSVGYLAVNGYVLFDRYDLIVGAAGPAFAATLVWSGMTLFDFITEASERARITRRFSSYVDPVLVNWVISHPAQARFDGEAREMTMGFTDLAGFTTLTEALGERTVPLLAEYMGKMIPIIRAHSGYVSRLMGDGIYFFFGAPEPDSDHATHAVDTALEMHAAVDALNLTFPKRNFPQLTMRAGLSTGRVIVGDAGSVEFSDYTAVGDSVNLGARLEAANKVFGTRMLITARTVELLNGAFLVRPIANLRVAGKTKGVLVYEALSRLERATEQQRELAELTARLTTLFQRGEFQGCKEAAEEMDRSVGGTTLTKLYSRLCNEHLLDPPENFDGLVVLTEK